MRIPRVGAALPTGDVIWSCSSLPFEHEQGPYVLLGHDFQGLEDGDLGRNGQDLVALGWEELRDLLTRP